MDNKVQQGEGNSLFKILNKDSNKYNIYNYFYYKLFDFNGESLDFNSFSSYQNNKIELFKENIEEKEKYKLVMSCDDCSSKYMESEEEYNVSENYFGPQRGKNRFTLDGNQFKINNKDHNFKPY